VPRWTPDREGFHADPVLRDRYPLVLLTTRQRQALNSSHADVLTSRDKHPWMEISIADATARHVADGDRVRVRVRVHNVNAAWRRAEDLIKTTRLKDCDEALILLVDLHDLAERDGRSADAAHRLRVLRETYRRRTALLQRLDRVGLDPATT